jgi:hypothetical protein
MSQIERPFRRSSHGYFMEIPGPARYKKKPWYEHEVGVLWAMDKEHPRLFCSVQDDRFTAPFRPS